MRQFPKYDVYIRARVLPSSHILSFGRLRLMAMIMQTGPPILARLLEDQFDTAGTWSNAAKQDVEWMTQYILPPPRTQVPMRFQVVDS
eukprot:1184843-Pyramimonas_sp.AAC.1